MQTVYRTSGKKNAETVHLLSANWCHLCESCGLKWHGRNEGNSLIKQLDDMM